MRCIVYYFIFIVSIVTIVTIDTISPIYVFLFFCLKKVQKKESHSRLSNSLR